MKLYEVTNGWLGESHVRLYAWAESEEQALEMAAEQFKREALALRLPRGRYPSSYWERLSAEVLFDASEMPFATKPSDGGWERE